MGKHEKIELAPPAPIAPTVLAHRKKLEAERDGLRTGVAELALKSALGDTEAQATLAAIPAKQAELEFEINLSRDAVEAAEKHDREAYVAWRESLQAMDPEDLIAGINREECCGLCRPHATGGCVITASYPYSGGQCGHPIRELSTVFGRDVNGDRRFLYAHNPQAARVFEAARRRLKVPTR